MIWQFFIGTLTRLVTIFCTDSLAYSCVDLNWTNFCKISMGDTYIGREHAESVSGKPCIGGAHVFSGTELQSSGLPICCAIYQGNHPTWSMTRIYLRINAEVLRRIPNRLMKKMKDKSYLCSQKLTFDNAHFACVGWYQYPMGCITGRSTRSEENTRCDGDSDTHGNIWNAGYRGTIQMFESGQRWIVSSLNISSCPLGDVSAIIV